MFITIQLLYYEPTALRTCRGGNASPAVGFETLDSWTFLQEVLFSNYSDEFPAPAILAWCVFVDATLVVVTQILSGHLCSCSTAILGSLD